MLFEDVRYTRAAMKVVLRRQSFRVITVADGHQAVNVIRAGTKPGLVILDMLLPIEDGWHFIDWVHSHPECGDIPILITTGTPLSADCARDIGCAGVLKKPLQADP